MTPAQADVVVIGAGVVGTAIARTLARYSLDLVLLDAAPDVGTGTSKANTAILHTGFDAKPGSLESRLVRRGSALLRAYAEAAGIPVERTGALLVAWTPEQAAALPAIAENARRNGYLAVRPLRAEELYARSPSSDPGRWRRWRSRTRAIICPWTTPLAFATEAAGAGVRLMLGATVTGVTSCDGYRLATTRGPLRGRWVVNAAGLGSDEVDRMFGGDGFTIAAAAGRAHRVRQAGPHADPLDPAAGADGADQGGAGRAHRLRERAARARPPRTLPIAAIPLPPRPGSARCSRPGGGSCPGWPREEVTSTYAGLRAATEHADYQIRVDAERRYACAGGIRSTGLSASLGIAEYVVGQLGEAGLALRPRAAGRCRSR